MKLEIEPDGRITLSSCNYIESLLGIETLAGILGKLGVYCCNYIESLLGIETGLPEDPTGLEIVATILNPY